MWQLLALTFYGVVKTLDYLSDSGGPSRAHREAPSRDSDRTQDVNGYTRWDGTSVRSYRRRPPR